MKRIASLLLVLLMILSMASAALASAEPDAAEEIAAEETVEEPAVEPDTEAPADEMPVEEEETITADGDVTYIKADGNVTVNLSEDGVLTISGSGAIDSLLDPVPASKVKKAIIEEGITNIGRWAFEYCVNMTEVTIPDM